MKQKRNTFLTMEEKKELILQGKSVPVCVGECRGDRNRFIAKIRSIYDGSLTNKSLKL